MGQSLYIIDNGERYSDHIIYFVADPGYPREQVEALIELFKPPHYLDAKFKILGHGEMAWFEGKLRTFEALMDDMSYRLDGWAESEYLEDGRKRAALVPPALRALLPEPLRED